MPEGEGYPAPPDEREFPDLSPIRPRDARLRDTSGPGDWPGQQAQPGQYGQPGQPDQYGQPVGGGYAGGYPAGAEYGQSGQAPWAEQEWAPQSQPQSRHAQPQPAPVQPAPVRQAPPAQAQPQPSQPQQARQEEEVPSWAEPDSVEAFSARWHRRGLDSRDDRRSDRRSRRRLLIAGGGAVAVVIAVAVYFLTGSSGHSSNLGFGSLVTQFLPGEVETVPNACDTVPNATLSQYLPDSPTEAAPPLNTGTNSQCSWTMDDAPTYRVLEVQVEAYTPSALVANSNGTGLVPEGNGSATYAAEAAFASYDYNLVNPAAKSGQPVATVADVSGMPGGDDTSAFSATQVFDRGNAITDEVSVYVRYRNVIVIAAMEGLDRSSTSKKYGPVVMSDLAAAAQAIAKQVAGQIVH